jgi:hypothetical protein
MTARVELQSERELQRQCEQLLNLRGIPFLHLSSRSREKAGWPDLTFPRPRDGKFVAVELKAKHGKVSNEQITTLAKLARNGAEAQIVRDFDHFRNVVDGPRKES